MSLEGAAERVKTLLKEIPFTTDYWAEIGGDYEDRLRAQKDFRLAFIFTTLLIFAVLACLFESLIQPLFLFVSLPLAVIGIVSALLVTGTPVTIGAIIGILMTLGVAVNHSILYMNRYNTGTKHEAGGPATRLIAVGKDRLRPILITTLTTVLGLLPMALDHSSGAHLWRPMAIATIGGLLGSMVLTLYILPVLLSMRFQFRPIAGFLLFCFMAGMAPPLLSESIEKEAETLPPWVNKIVHRRVKDLLTKGKGFEKKSEFSQAIESYLEAVRLDPQNYKARKALLRANKKGMKERRREIERTRNKWVTEAQDKRRAERSWQDAMEGKMKEASRHWNSGRLSQAVDQYYRILEEAPFYQPALRALEGAGFLIKERLEEGGFFFADDEKEVARGFAFYIEEDWIAAFLIWDELLKDVNLAQKWGTIRLGEYAARARRFHEETLRRNKIDKALGHGLVYFRNGNLKEALAQFELALELDPSHERAKEYADLIPGLMERARADVLEEVEKQQVARTLSDALEFYLKGYYDEAESKVQLILDTDPQHPQALSLKNDIAKSRGLAPVRSLKELEAEQSLKLEELYSDGIIAFAEGRYKDARAAWKAVLKENPTHERAIKALKKLETESIDPKDPKENSNESSE